MLSEQPMVADPQKVRSLRDNATGGGWISGTGGFWHQSCFVSSIEQRREDIGMKWLRSVYHGALLSAYVAGMAAVTAASAYGLSAMVS